MQGANTFLAEIIATCLVHALTKGYGNQTAFSGREEAALGGTLVCQSEGGFKVEPSLQREWIEVSGLLPNVSPKALAECRIKTHASKELRSFSEAMAAYLLEVKRAGRDASYQKHLLRGLRRFAGHYGDKSVADITSMEVSDFIHGLPFEPLTKRHYRTYLVGAFKWFVKQGWAESSPASAIPSPKVHLAELGILTVAETQFLFRSNEKEDPEICGSLE